MERRQGPRLGTPQGPGWPNVFWVAIDAGMRPVTALRIQAHHWHILHHEGRTVWDAPSST